MSKGISKVSQKNKEKTKEKIPITFNREQLKLVEKYMGIMGNTKAEIIRNILINWLLEREVNINGKKR